MNVAAEMRGRILDGQVVDIRQLADELSVSEKVLRDVIDRMRRRQGIAVDRVAPFTYALSSGVARANSEEARPRRSRHHPVTERAASAPPLGARLQVSGLAIAGKAKVVITLTDGHLEWAVYLHTGPKPSWAQNVG